MTGKDIFSFAAKMREKLVAAASFRRLSSFGKLSGDGPWWRTGEFAKRTGFSLNTVHLTGNAEISTRFANYLLM